MPARRILAIDQGTTNSKVVLLDEAGRAVATASRPLDVHYPQPGWVQQDPRQIWSSVVDATRECLAAVEGGDVAAIGISNQRESALAWDRHSGAPLGPCITWQCRRTSPFTDDLKARGLAPWLESATGLTVDPLFSASKWRWLLDSIPHGHARAADGEICLGTVDSWLVWKLTDGAVHATDASNASRTQLYDLAMGGWSEALTELFGIPLQALAEVRSSNAFYGEAASREFPVHAPIQAVAGDSHAAMFGHGAFSPGTVKATFGTGSSLMALTAERAEVNGLSSTVAWRLGPHTTLALEGNIASTGATLEWLGRLLGHEVDAGGAAARLAAETDDSKGVFLVPAFAGLGAPHWDDHARGLICGLSRGSGAREIARAALESIAYQVADVFDLVAQAAAVSELRADGGASRNDTLMQLQADIIGRPVVRDQCADLSAFGIGCMAGMGAGLWDLGALADLPRTTNRFEPRMPSERVRELRQAWRTAIRRTKVQSSTEELHP